MFAQDLMFWKTVTEMVLCQSFVIHLPSISGSLSYEISGRSRCVFLDAFRRVSKCLREF